MAVVKMIDALYPLSIPAGTECDAIAAYIDHPANVSSYAQAVARFPDAVHVKISAHAPGTVGADVLDVEPGTHITPQQAVAWVVASRAHGIDPTVYCNQGDPSWGWPACRAAFAAAKVPEPYWWVANYDGDPAIPAGAAAKQYTDLDQNGRNTYDTSATAPGWMEDDVITAADIEAIAEKVLGEPVGKDTGTLRQTVHDARVAARGAEVAAQQALAQAAATLSAVQQLAGGQAIDYAKVQTAVDQALASYTLTLTKAGS